jgi:hypothetical protein
MSRLQENDADGITALMNRAGLEYHPVDLGLDRCDLKEPLRALQSYTESAGLWHSIIQEREITDKWIDKTLSKLRFCATQKSHERPESQS